MTELTIVCKQATYVVNNKSTIYYPSAGLALRAEEATNDSYIFLYFEIPPDLVGKNPSYAHLRARAYSVYTDATRTQRHAKPKTSYSKMQGNNDPAVLAGSAAVTGTRDPADQTWWDFDVIADATSISVGGSYYGFRLVTDSTTPRRFYGVKSDTPPVLLLTYSDVPETPTDVKPAGGVVSVSKPWVTWANGKDIDAVQVQVKHAIGAAWNEDTGYTAPTFDSGSFGSTTGQFNLAASAYTGLVDTGLQDSEISVRQHGPDGWSKYSKPRPVGYASRPSSYAWASPLATSGDPTPPHVVTGTPVDHWLMFLRDVATGRVLWNSGLTSGDDTTATPDAGPKDVGQAVVSVARLWDRQDRIATVGEPEYTEITQAWSYAPDTDAAGFTSCSATQVDGTPEVALQMRWTGTLPDEILVTRADADARIARFAFDENTIGTGAWELSDWSCPPNTRDVEYAFTPIINGVAGPSYKVGITVELEGHWLVDETDGTWVTFSGMGGSKALAESSAAYVPLTGSRVITRTSGQRGEEGTREVSLWDYESVEVQEFVENFMILRKRATTRELRQVGGRSNYKVVALNMNVTDDEENQLIDQDVRLASWTFFQSDYPDDADGLSA